MAGRPYQTRILALLGADTYVSQATAVAVTNASFAVPDLHASSTADSITVVWTAPDTGTAVVAYRLWLTFAAPYNGFQLQQADVVLDVELRRPGLLAPQSVAPGTRAHTFAGCFAVSVGGKHCLQPWTLYSVHVAPLAAEFDGAPAAVLVATQPTPQPAPVNIAVLDTTEQTATLQWDMPFRTGIVDAFVFVVAAPGIDVQQFRSGCCTGACAHANASLNNTLAPGFGVQRFAWTIGPLSAFTKYASACVLRRSPLQLLHHRPGAVIRHARQHK